MNGITVLNPIRAQGLLVLHDTARVDQTLSVNRDILEFGTGKLLFQIGNGSSLGHGDSMLLIARRLHLEGDLRVRAALGWFGHFRDRSSIEMLRRHNSNVNSDVLGAISISIAK